MHTPHQLRQKATAADGDILFQQINVPFQYNVHFTNGLFDADNPILADTIMADDASPMKRVLVYVDAGVAEATEGLVSLIETYFAQHAPAIQLVQPPRLLAGGEQVKNGWWRVQSIMAEIGDHRLCRHSYVLAVGGGAVLDMVGFAASIVHRGLRMIRIPTTVLAQNDAGIGVKTSMNEHGQKNFVGTFAPPHAVINDFEFLKTLPFKEWTSGISEAFKVAIIRDKVFLDGLCEGADGLRCRDQLLMEWLVRRCAELHLAHIREGGDPFESGAARPLDFGHWAAHKLELMSDFSIGHGQAVAMGVALDTLYAVSHGSLEQADADRILRGLHACGLPLWHDVLGRTDADARCEILGGLEDFRDHLGGKLTITLPRGVGDSIEIHAIDESKMIACIQTLRERSQSLDQNRDPKILAIRPPA